MHLPEMADPYLKHCDLVLLAQPEDRERQAEVVVEIACRLQGAVLLGENRGDHLLCARLADAACDSDHWDLQLLQIVRGDRAERPDRVVDQDIISAALRQPLLGDDTEHPLLKNAWDKVVPVHPRARDGREQAARFRLAAVRGDRHHLPVRVLVSSYIYTAARLRHTRQGHMFHPAPPFP